MSKTINRIIIGDVGSGKTITAFLIGLSYLEGLVKGQVALMAPTEVLAFQHYQSLLNLKKSSQNIFEKFNFEFTTIYLSGKTYQINGQKYTKKQLEKYWQNNHPKKIVWIGTHALLFNEEVLADLIMIDEQHRFGVEQRKLLAEKMAQKSQSTPHFLSFTATPIPRTLALALYGELKPHFLEILKERTKIQTTIQNIENLDNFALPKIQEHLKQDRKVFVICPRIEESEDENDEMFSVSKVFKLMEGCFPNKVVMVHGKVSDKKDILSQFKEDKQKQILVSTTVIEVGVDIKEASLMIIFNAERFGLSALHQIRGRVGRNSYQDNECILLTYKKYSQSQRLSHLVNLHDGFELAQKDLEIRGAGDFLGRLQSGFDKEIDEIMGLDPDLYKGIDDLVSQVDFEELPRLKKFVEKAKNQTWGE